ncbi:hypothetical protein [Microvirga pudoricolor]|uniref:hypothetical protein n=1 Tax=Microvirga pudoricolor TaxID=2778729 RepID=UPI00194F8100|nr:hypothetical protein [Microvirga pudoricolor]MBM6592910.1 hypothetical protein [Microvirga pudoricolor]
MPDFPASASWHPGVDSLRFRPHGHEGDCFVHRLAFRTLIGTAPSPEECAAFFVKQADAFGVAAALKIERRNLATDAHFHLTSRDILRAMENGLKHQSLSA